MRYLILFLIILQSCSSPEQPLIKQKWKTDHYIDSTQILLTNEYMLNGSFGFGASSFLLRAKKNTPVLCTAKHLLGEAMGITPEVETDRFNHVLKYWYSYARQNTITDHTVHCARLINEEINDTDIILLEYKKDTTTLDFQILTPRLSKLHPGEKLELIGCEYSDLGCHQKKYNATLISYEADGMFVIKPETDFDVSGFSGAPVLDKNGYVVGVLSGGGIFNEEKYLWIEPLTKIREWLE